MQLFTVCKLKKEVYSILSLDRKATYHLEYISPLLDKHNISGDVILKIGYILVADAKQKNNPIFRRDIIDYL